MVRGRMPEWNNHESLLYVDYQLKHWIFSLECLGDPYFEQFYAILKIA